MIKDDFLSGIFYSVPNLRYYHSDKLSKVKLGNICSITGGYAFDSRKMKSKGEYQIIKMGNLYNGVLDLTRNPSFIDNPTKKELEYLIHKNDILITLTGTVNKKDYGYTVQLNNPNNLLLNQRCALIKPLNINEKYLFYLLNSNNFFKQFYASSTGGTGNQTNVSINDMLNFNMYIANEKNQIIISEFLNKIDQRIETQIKIIKDLKMQRDHLIHSVFSSMNSKLLLITDIAEVYQPQTISSEKFDEGAEFPVFGANGIIGHYEKYNHENEQICIACRGSSVGTINISKKKSWITGNSMVINSDNYDDMIDKKFLYYQLMFIDFYKYISGSGQPQITRESLKNLKIKVPSLAIQHSISNFLNHIDLKITIEAELLCQYQLQKSYLLKNMFI